jgi:hypothetical protein
MLSDGPAVRLTVFCLAGFGQQVYATFTLTDIVLGEGVIR